MYYHPINYRRMKMKLYAITHELKGRMFCFNAIDEIDANIKAEIWADRHAMKIGGNFKLEETNETFDLHNEFMPKVSN